MELLGYIKLMQCFVIMPFAKDFNDVYDAIRLSIHSVDVGERVICRRLDEVKAAGRITDDLVREISQSAICIADITGLNANVMWEVGFAMALGKPTLLMTQNLAELPFDLKDMRTISYDRISLSTTLRIPLSKALRDTFASVKARTEMRRLPAERKSGHTIAITGSNEADQARTQRRLKSLLQPYLSSETNWLVGSWGAVDELATQYLAENGQSVVVVSSRGYHVSQRSLDLVEKYNLTFLPAEQEQIPRGLKAPSNREAIFLQKADLIILLWNGESPGIRKFVEWYTQQGRDFILAFV